MTGTNDIQLKPKNGQQFYTFSMLELANEQGRQVKNEVKKTIHASIQWLEQDRFLIHLEFFDRVQKNKDLSPSDKDFNHYITSIIDDVKVQSDAHANIRMIYQPHILQQKAAQTIDHLSVSFIGLEAERTFKVLNAFYNNETVIIRHLQAYSQYGLLLSPHYGQYSSGTHIHTVCHPKFVGHTDLYIREQATLISAEGDNDETKVEITGTLDTPDDEITMTERIRNKGITAATPDRFTVDQYTGHYTFCQLTGQVKEAGLIMKCSCGSNYSKSIYYELKSVSYENI